MPLATVKRGSLMTTKSQIHLQSSAWTLYLMTQCYPSATDQNTLSQEANMGSSCKGVSKRARERGSEREGAREKEYELAPLQPLMPSRPPTQAQHCKSA